MVEIRGGEVRELAENEKGDVDKGGELEERDYKK